MTNIDLTDAYLTVPIHQTSQKFISFLWQGTSYQFVTMPFGLNARGQGVRMIIFQDDILVLAPLIKTLNQHTRMTISHSHPEDVLFGDAHRLNNDGFYFAKAKIRKYSKRVSASFEDTSAIPSGKYHGWWGS
jgi:hypothetical protein